MSPTDDSKLVKEVVSVPLLAPKVLENAEGDNERPKDAIVLYLAAFGASLIIIGSGAAVVWTSPAISSLKSNNTDVNPLGKPVTTIEVSHIAGLNILGAVFGPIAIARVCDVIGRKNSLILISAGMLVANVVLAFAKTLYLYYLTRFILGLGVGAGTSTISIFLSEISEDHNRGRMGCFLALTFPLGNLYVYVVGPIFSIQNLTLLCALPLVLNLLALLTFIPESPVYLATKGKREACLRALKRLRSKSPAGIEKEYERIAFVLKETSNRKEGVLNVFLGICKTRSSRKGLIIALGCCIFQQLSGVVVLLAFAAPLFDEAKAGVSGSTTAVLIGVVKLASVLIALAVIEKAGRRPLMLISSFGVTCSLFVLGFFFYLQSIHSPWVSSLLWLPIVGVLSYFLAFQVGFGSVVIPLISELFPSHVRSAIVSFSTCILFTTTYFAVTSFPIIKELVGPTWVLWGYGCTSLLGFAFIYLTVPEIKGKSFLEIQEILNK